MGGQRGATARVVGARAMHLRVSDNSHTQTLTTTTRAEEQRRHEEAAKRLAEAQAAAAALEAKNRRVRFRARSRGSGTCFGTPTAHSCWLPPYYTHTHTHTHTHIHMCMHERMASCEKSASAERGSTKRNYAASGWLRRRNESAPLSLPRHSKQSGAWWGSAVPRRWCACSPPATGCRRRKQEQERLAAAKRKAEEVRRDIVAGMCWHRLMHAVCRGGGCQDAKIAAERMAREVGSQRLPHPRRARFTALTCHAVVCAAGIVCCVVSCCAVFGYNQAEKERQRQLAAAAAAQQRREEAERRARELRARLAEQRRKKEEEAAHQRCALGGLRPTLLPSSRCSYWGCGCVVACPCQGGGRETPGGGCASCSIAGTPGRHIGPAP